MNLRIAILSLLCMLSVSFADAARSISKDGIVVDFTSSNGLKITVDGLVFSRYSDFYVGNFGNTVCYAYTQSPVNGTDTVITNGSKMVTTLTGSTGKFSGTQTIEILDGRKIRMTMTGKQTAGSAMTLQLIQLSVDPAWFAGGTYTMVPTTGSTKNGTISATPTGSQVAMFSNMKNLTVNTALGAVVMAWTGPAVSMRDDRINNYNSSVRQFIAGPFANSLANNTTFTSVVNITFPTAASTKPALAGTLTGSPVQQSLVMDEQVVRRIVPSPKSVTWLTGDLALHDAAGVYVQNPPYEMPFMDKLRALLIDKTQRKLGVTMQPTDDAAAAAVKLLLTPSLANQKPEQYSVTVNMNTAVLEAATTAGLLNAVQTYEQLLSVPRGGVLCATVSDWPSMPMRAIHFFTGKGTGARDIQMSMLRHILGPLKCNTLVYECEYINWACDPKLNYAPYGMDIALVKDVIAEAAAQFVEIVPLVNSFGHCEWFLRQHPELADNPSQLLVYDATNPATYDLMGKVYDECIALFKPMQIHIGHDEIDSYGTYPVKPAAQAIGKNTLILNDTKYWVNFLKARGIKTWAWADMFLGPGESPSAALADSVAAAQNFRSKLPKDLVMVNWDYAAASPSQFPGLDILANAGFPTLSGTWYTPMNMTNFAQATVNSRTSNSNTFGMVQTTWAGFTFDASSYAANRYQYESYVQAAEQMWTGGTTDLNTFDFASVYARQMGESPLADTACGGFYYPLYTPAGHYHPTKVGAVPTNWANAGLYLGRFIAPPPTDGTQPGVVMSGIFHYADSNGYKGYTDLSFSLNQAAEKLVFIGASTGANADNVEVSRVKLTYIDRTTVEIPIRGGVETAGLQDVSGTKDRVVIPTGSTNASGLPVNYHGYVWTNPSPLKPILLVKITSDTNSSGWYLRGLTGLVTPPALVRDWSLF